MQLTGIETYPQRELVSVYSGTNEVSGNENLAGFALTRERRTTIFTTMNSPVLASPSKVSLKSGSFNCER
jgi:hypothetical protein